MTKRDLSERIRVAAEFFDAVPIGIALRDTEGRYLFVNRTWERYIGYSREQIIGTRIYDRLPKAQADAIVALDRAALEAKGDEPAAPEVIIYKDRRFTQTRTVMRDGEGVLGVLIASVDTTEQQKQQERLRDQMELTRLLIEENPNAMFLKDPAGRYVTVNDAWLSMVGLRREQAIGRTVLELFPEKESERYHAEDLRLLAGADGASEMESQRTGPDGRPQWVIIRKAVLRRHDGAVLGLVGTNTNITRLKRYEQALEDKTRFITELVETLPISVTMRDLEGRYVLVNRTWERYFGVPREHALGKRRREFPAGLTQGSRLNVVDEIERLDREILQQGPGYVAEPEEVHRQGRVYVMTRSLLTDSAGKPLGVLSAGLDTTEQHAMAEALKDSMRLREEVERMSRHDLKTPLNSVIAVSRMLRENAKLGPEDQELLGIVERAGYRILRMVNLSLDLFRMEKGSYTFRPQAIDLAEVSRKVIADLESQAASKNVAIRVRQSEPAVARGEELLCYSMLANLIKNAIEAEREDGIVTVSLEAAGGAVFARVHNAGEVPAEVRARFFDKYATSGKSAGLGLGTYSARLMARVQEGDITLESSAGHGTTVSVRLAQSRVPTAPVISQAQINLGSQEIQLPALRVLVVDDDEFNRLVLRRYLPSPPLKVALAVNGRAALQYVKRHWPDFVFLDLEMPVMDGYETAARLREVEAAEGRKPCTIVAISSNDDEAIVQRALAAGCDRYLVKPAPREVIWQLLKGSGVAPAAPEKEALASDPVELDADLHAALPGFLASRREMLAAMEATLQTGDRGAFRRQAHKLAGSFALYGFRWAAGRCRALEREAVESDAAGLAGGMGEVIAHLENVEVKVREPART